MSSEFLDHYALGQERMRLLAGAGPLEQERSREILRRRLPRPPARVLDVGGGPGAYACWLAGEGYEVHLVDPAFAALVAADLRDGQHRNPTQHPAYFTTAFFHRPEELPAEAHDAGLSAVEMVGIEGPGWLFADFSQRWTDPGRRRQLLDAARAVEHEASLIALSPHLMLVARALPEERP